MGVGTDHYANAFRDPQSFEKLVVDAQEEIAKSGRAPVREGEAHRAIGVERGLRLGREDHERAVERREIDAVLLADGFFTSFTNLKKRAINTASLERFVTLVDSASKGEKLFAITHSAIPTQDYPSVEETVAKLLELTSSSKTPSTNVGPRNMHETYVVDRGAVPREGLRGRDHGQSHQADQRHGRDALPVPEGALGAAGAERRATPTAAATSD